MAKTAKNIYNKNCLKMAKIDLVTTTLLDSIYSKINRYILLSVGLSPNQSKIKKGFIFVLFSFSSLSLIIALGRGLFESWSTNKIIYLETVLAILYISIGFLVYILLYFKENEFIELNTKITQDWEKLADNTEFEILQSFTRQGQIIGFTVIVYAVPVILVFGGTTFIPALLNTNMKDYHPFPYYTDLMIINKATYIHQICIHSLVSLFYMGIFWLALSSIFISSVKHICAMHTIICYRLSNITESRKKLLTIDQLKDEKSIKFDLVNIINKHNKTIREVNMIEQIFSTSFFVIGIAALISIAALIYELKYNQSNILQVFRVSVIFILYVIYIFYFHWVGQQILQTSQDILHAAYFLDWFLLSTKARELLCMIIRRGCKSDKLTAGKIMTLSMESFASIMKASWSVATVLITTQRSYK